MAFGLKAFLSPHIAGVEHEVRFITLKKLICITVSVFTYFGKYPFDRKKKLFYK
jgi:hypothetical protein